MKHRSRPSSQFPCPPWGGALSPQTTESLAAALETLIRPLDTAE